LTDIFRAGPTQPAQKPVKKFVAFLSQIPPRGPFLPVVPVFNYCAVNNLRFAPFLDTEEVAGSNPVVPTIFKLLIISGLRTASMQSFRVRSTRIPTRKRFAFLLFDYSAIWSSFAERSKAGFTVSRFGIEYFSVIILD
jgi:hypothetical protein